MSSDNRYYHRSHHPVNTKNTSPQKLQSRPTINTNLKKNKTKTTTANRSSTERSTRRNQKATDSDVEDGLEDLENNELPEDAPLLSNSVQLNRQQSQEQPIVDSSEISFLNICGYCIFFSTRSRHHSHPNSNRPSSSSTMSPINTCDLFKVLFLFVFTGFAFFTYLDESFHWNKVTPVDNSGSTYSTNTQRNIPKTLHLMPKYDVCDRYLNQIDAIMIEKCRSELKTVFDKAEKDCQGYYSQYYRCPTNVDCDLFDNNVKSCIEFTVQPAVLKWNHL